MKLLTPEFASTVAQHSRKVQNTERDLIEIVKYGSKIFTEPDVNKKSVEKISPLIYVSALNNILCAMKDNRFFDRFGFNLPTEKHINTYTKELDHYKAWEFDLKHSDWIDSDSDQLLSGFTPKNELSALLSNNIDKCLE